LREITFREVGEGTNESIDLTNLINTTTFSYGTMMQKKLQEHIEWD
jgi:hypothetical protein